MRYYPIYADISKKRCVVVGGGEVAWRKVERLMECGADVVVIGTELVGNLALLVREGKVRHIPDEYKKEYITDAWLVIGATDCDDVNGAVCLDSRALKIPVNIVDDPEQCDFILPSVYRRGDLAMAISTGGKSPALAKMIRKELERCYGPEYQVLLDIMGTLRKEIIARGNPSDENKRIFEAILNTDILHQIRNHNVVEISRIVREAAGVEVDEELKMIICRDSNK